MTNTIDTTIRNALGVRPIPNRLSDPATREEYLKHVINIVSTFAPDRDQARWAATLAEKAMARGGPYPDLDVWAEAATGGTPKPREQEPAQRAQGPAVDREGLTQTEYSFRIFVKRVSEGAPVSEFDIFGKRAERALSERLLSYGQIKRYQVAAFYAHSRQYGEENAYYWLEDKNPKLLEELKAGKAAPAPTEADHGDF